MVSGGICHIPAEVQLPGWAGYPCLIGFAQSTFWDQTTDCMGQLSFVFLQISVLFKTFSTHNKKYTVIPIYIAITGTALTV